MYKYLLGIALVLSCQFANAFELKTVQVTDNVYALVGSTEARTEENLGLNNTLGFIIAKQSVILVSSGTSAESVAVIRKAIKAVSDKPIKHVINTGTQDHHWMGNHHFIKDGAKVIALAKTAASQKENLESQLSRLEMGIKQQMKTVKPVHANHVVQQEKYSANIDGVDIELLWPGRGHYHGDAVLWLPKEKVMFTGDFIYMHRMLGIHPTSDASEWQKSFHKIMAYKPEHIVPGHGMPTDIAGAKRDTGDYLDWLIKNVRAAQEDWKEIDETISELSDTPQFKHMIHFDSWHRRNIHQTFLQLEAAG